MNDRDEIDRNTAAVHRRDLARLLRLLVVAAVLIELLLFGLDNRDDVRIGYVVGDTSGPIWLVILASALGGLLIGALTRRRSTRD